MASDKNGKHSARRTPQQTTQLSKKKQASTVANGNHKHSGSAQTPREERREKREDTREGTIAKARGEMNSDDVTLLYTMRAPPGSVGMKSDDVIVRDAVKLT